MRAATGCAPRSRSYFEQEGLKPQRLLEAKASGEPGWSWRKALIYPNVAVSFWMLYLLKDAADTCVNEAIAWGMTLDIVGSVFIPTGFATAQDITAIFATKTGLPYGPPAAADDHRVNDPERDERE